MMDEKWWAAHRAAMVKRTGANNPAAKIVIAVAPDGTRYVGSLNSTAKHIGRNTKSLRDWFRGKNHNTTEYTIEYKGQTYPPRTAANTRGQPCLIQLIGVDGYVAYKGTSRGASKFMGRCTNAVQLVTKGKLKNHTGYTIVRDGVVYCRAVSK